MQIFFVISNKNKIAVYKPFVWQNTDGYQFYFINFAKKNTCEF